MSDPVVNVDDLIEIARETCSGDIRDFLLDRLKKDKNPLPWDSQSEASQRATIDAATAQAKKLVEAVARVVISEGRSMVNVAVEQVVVKDGIKAVVSCPNTAFAREHLGAFQGRTVAVVFMDTEPMDGQKKPVFVKPDQGDIIDAIANADDAPAPKKGRGKKMGDQGTAPPPAQETPHDPETGEVIEPPGEISSSEPGSGEQAPSGEISSSEPGSPDTSGDQPGEPEGGTDTSGTSDASNGDGPKDEPEVAAAKRRGRRSIKK